MEEYNIIDLEVKYHEKFGELPPVLPYNLPPTSDWFETLLLLAINTNTKINPDDLKKYISKNNIKYDLVEE